MCYINKSDLTWLDLPVLADEEVHQVSGLVGLASGDHQRLQVLKVSGLQHLLLLPALVEEHQHRLPDLRSAHARRRRPRFQNIKIQWVEIRKLIRKNRVLQREFCQWLPDVGLWDPSGEILWGHYPLNIWFSKISNTISWTRMWVHLHFSLFIAHQNIISLVSPQTVSLSNSICKAWGHAYTFRNKTLYINVE